PAQCLPEFACPARPSVNKHSIPAARNKDQAMVALRAGPISRLNLATAPAPLFAVAYSPDGHRLATGGACGAVQVWDAKELALETVLHAHRRAVWSVAFAPDGQTLASGSHDG